MKNVERRDRQLPYISDAEVMEQQMNARRLTQKLNTIDRSDFDGIAAIVKELFGKSEGAFVKRLQKKINSIISRTENLMMRHGKSSKICKNEKLSWAVMR